mmetsp:Transcript_18351/g.33050  ORF Transcript_18351/g.33050 Transcript_18351/m.33050 type:complete len:221 (-) Transcript_18351:155-817(-)
MILNTEHLKQDLGVSAEDIAQMRNKSEFCSFLEGRRAKKYEKRLENLGQKVQDLEEMHYRTQSFRNSIGSNGAGHRREQLNFLFEINGISFCGNKPYCDNNMKEKFICDHNARLKAHEKREKETRQRARNCESCAEAPLLLEAGDTSHFGILGVSRKASKQEIVRAFRRLSLAYHPDKNKNENAREHFLKIKEARDVLLNDRKRSAYDKSLGEENDQVET